MCTFIIFGYIDFTENKPDVNNFHINLSWTFVNSVGIIHWTKCNQETHLFFSGLNSPKFYV
jgi:hypothetical protein